MKLYNPIVGLGLMAIYAALVYICAYWYSRRMKKTKTGYLLADREVSEWKAGYSIASSWIWAPSLFVSAQIAYNKGLPGMFWFILPNALVLFIFGYFAKEMRDRVPEGFTFPDYMRDRYSMRVHNLYMIQNMVVMTCCIAIQSLAGGSVVSMVTGIPYFWTSILMAGIGLSYSYIYGLRASVITDYLKMNIIFILGSSVIGWTFVKSGGLATFEKGLGGISGNYTSLFGATGWEVFWGYGIPLTIGLMSGPFGDQAFWQRGWATQKEKIKGAFFKSMIIFAIVPLLLGTLGFLAAGTGFKPKNMQFVNLETVLNFLPTWTALFFVFMLMSGMISTIDTHITAIASLGGQDIAGRMGVNPLETKRVLKFSRTLIVASAIFGIGIANIPGMQIWFLWLIYMTFRTATMLPTMISVFTPDNRINEKGVFWGILMSLLIGYPVFFYGHLNKIPTLVSIGMLLTMVISGLLTWAFSYKKNYGWERGKVSLYSQAKYTQNPATY